MRSDCAAQVVAEAGAFARRPASAGRTACGSWSSCRCRWARGIPTPGLRGTCDVDMIDRDLAAEALGQAVHVDGERRHGAFFSAAAAVSTGHTSTGKPGRSGSPVGARASALNTSRSRLPTL